MVFGVPDELRAKRRSKILVAEHVMPYVRVPKMLATLAATSKIRYHFEFSTLYLNAVFGDYKMLACRTEPQNAYPEIQVTKDTTEFQISLQALMSLWRGLRLKTIVPG